MQKRADSVYEVQEDCIRHNRYHGKAQVSPGGVSERGKIAEGGDLTNRLFGLSKQCAWECEGGSAFRVLGFGGRTVKRGRKERGKLNTR